ncbi:hypothetical protein SNE40_021212 [Patella caerulea]|uniref:ZAD domain-containing protein n=1 Tax=Patella caerulea TaxID=87958 RepID=A0AAN8GGK6_PATCE
MADRITFCRICSGIIGVKNRRLLFSPAFLVNSELNEILGYQAHINDGLSSYICLACFSKLTKLTKMQAITKSIQERRNIVLQLKSKIAPYPLLEQPAVGLVPAEENTELPVLSRKVTPVKQVTKLTSTPNRVKIEQPIVYVKTLSTKVKVAEKVREITV